VTKGEKLQSTKGMKRHQKMLSLTHARSRPSSCGGKHEGGERVSAWPAARSQHRGNGGGGGRCAHRQIREADVAQRLHLGLVHPVRQLRGHGVHVLEDCAEEDLLPPGSQHGELRAAGGRGGDRSEAGGAGSLVTRATPEARCDTHHNVRVDVTAAALQRAALQLGGTHLDPQLQPHSPLQLLAVLLHP
jgi:hypothetical protein